VVVVVVALPSGGSCLLAALAVAVAVVTVVIVGVVVVAVATAAGAAATAAALLFLLVQVAVGSFIMQHKCVTTTIRVLCPHTLENRRDSVHPPHTYPNRLGAPPALLGLCRLRAGGKML